MKRKIKATLHRGLSKEVVWTRYYSWLDTALPRALQLALQEGSTGDFVEFSSTEFGFHLALMRLQGLGLCVIERSDLSTTCPNLIRLLGGTW